MTNYSDSLAKDVVIDDQIVHIRPITGADIEIEKQLVNRFDPEGRYQRLLYQESAAPDKTDDSFHGIDFENKIAFVAIGKNASDKEEGLGVARYATDRYDHCEASVIVADGLQRHGLDQVLMKTLIEFARKHNKELIYAIDDIDDSYMQTLARDVGMTAQRDPNDANIMRYELLL